jgi:uncharacterized membrane protein YgcG
MKKIIKGIYLFAVIAISLVFTCPLNTYALTEQTTYININDIHSLEVGSLSFSNISFKDFSSTSTQAFGLSGIVENSSNNEINYTSTVHYYDSNYSLIARGYNFGTAISGSNSFSQMSNLSILNGRSTNEIYYYRLSIYISDYNTSSGSITSSINTPSKSSLYGSYEYVIDKYDINIVVNENNTFDITETITTYFNVSKHGIFRIIPLKNTITRLDGTTSTNRVQLTNLSVDNEYTTSRENGNLKVKIGSASSTLTGEQIYVIKYTYNMGKDPAKDYDELYYNIIGNEWDTVIGNVTFSITMPKEFDSSKLGFSSGTTGSTENSKVKYNVSENKITGSYNGILGVGEALTVRCELPEGYFVGAGLIFNFMNYIFFVIPIIFLVIALLLWYKYGCDDQIVETVQFYPPQGFNSLEVGFLYKGKAENQDVISLLIYLANQGYIKIAETEEKSLFSKSKGFKITKLKEYDGNNVNERIFLNGLFTKRPSISSGSLFSNNNIEQEPIDNINEVTSTDLYNNFYITMNRILSNINNKENKNKIFEKSASNKTIFIILMIIATYCLITIPPILAYGESESLLIGLLFPGIGFTVLFKLVLGETQTIYVNGKANNSSIGTKIFGLVWGLMFGGVPWAIVVLPALKQDLIYLIGYGLGLLCVLGMVICIKYLPKRTPYGNEILGKLKGFKNFLETAEKEKLEAMVMQDPTYFYNILPYTYVLGVSDKWIKKFESISLQAPSWYDSPNAFDMMTFGTFMNSTMTSAQSAMSSSPSSDSGGSSGGGSSGGGSGGGGGGSW